MALTKHRIADNTYTRDLLSDTQEDRRTRATVSDEFVHHILKSLTDNYQDPIEGMVRETISNALDSTALVVPSQRRDVEVISPSSFNMQFTVIDHGVGMDLETLKENYVQYGRSTKMEDFHQTGSKGMGAKAPLAYTNEFEAVSVKDGTKIHYVVRHEEDGIYGDPVRIEATDEPNGTTVTVALESQADIELFRHAIDAYRNHAYDLPIVIDGKRTTFFENYVETGTIVMDKATNTVGRVWMHKRHFWKFMPLKENCEDTNNVLDVRYLVTGWAYDLFGSNTKDEPDAFVELKPGLVEYNQSRDNIINNDRAKRLQHHIQRQLLDDDDVVRDHMIQAFNGITEREANIALAKLHKVMPVRTVIEENDNPVDTNRILVVRENLTVGLKSSNKYSDAYTHGHAIRKERRTDYYGDVYREFLFTVGELANRDGNAALELLQRRERGATLHHAYAMYRNSEFLNGHLFGPAKGGYGSGWESRNVPQENLSYFESMESREPSLLPTYNFRDDHGELTKFSRNIRANKTLHDVSPYSVQYSDGIVGMLVIVVDSLQKTSPLLRLRERIYNLISTNGVLDYTGKQRVFAGRIDTSTRNDDGQHYKNKLVIGHMLESDLDTLEGLKDFEHIVVYESDLRDGLRAANREQRKEASHRETGFDNVKEANRYELNVENLLGVHNASAEDIVYAATRRMNDSKVLNEDRVSWLGTEQSYKEKLRLEVQAMVDEDATIILSSENKLRSPTSSMRHSKSDVCEILKLLTQKVNTGQEITDGMVFYVLPSNALKTAEQEALWKQHTEFYVSKHWSYNAKKSREIHKERHIPDSLPDFAFAHLTDDDVLAFRRNGNLTYVSAQGVIPQVMFSMFRDPSLVEAADNWIHFVSTPHTSDRLDFLNTLKQGWRGSDGMVQDRIAEYELSSENAAYNHSMEKLWSTYRKVRDMLSDLDNSMMYNKSGQDISSMQVQHDMEATMANEILNSLAKAEYLRENSHVKATYAEGQDFLQVESLRVVLQKQFIARMEQAFHQETVQPASKFS